MADFETDLNYLLNKPQVSESVSPKKVVGGSYPKKDISQKEGSVKGNTSVRSRLAVKDIKRDLEDIRLSSDDEDDLKEAVRSIIKDEKRKVTKKKNNLIEGQRNDSVETVKKPRKRAPKAKKEETHRGPTNDQFNGHSNVETKSYNGQTKGHPSGPSADETPTEQNNVDNTEIVTKPKSKRSKKKTKKTERPEIAQSKEVQTDETKEVQIAEPKIPADEPKKTEPKQKREVLNLNKESSPEDPFHVKLKSVKVTHTNKKYSERLPKIQPIETIMGLSNEQIYKLSPSDIKLKKIISQTSGKLLNTIISFVTTHETIFEDEPTRDSFILLCINIAIHESRGLNKTLKQYPEIVETFSKYDELTLDYNQTKLTESDKKIHQNNLDYDFLSYIGNIIIWLSSQQRLEFIDESLIKANFGGYHLWDQLFKENSINMKRWKHIIKFRELFSYQPNQFMVIMKFLHIEL